MNYIIILISIMLLLVITKILFKKRFLNSIEGYWGIVKSSAMRNNSDITSALGE